MKQKASVYVPPLVTHFLSPDASLKLSKALHLFQYSPTTSDLFKHELILVCVTSCRCSFSNFLRAPIGTVGRL